MNWFLILEGLEDLLKKHERLAVGASDQEFKSLMEAEVQRILETIKEVRRMI